MKLPLNSWRYNTKNLLPTCLHVHITVKPVQSDTCVICFNVVSDVDFHSHFTFSMICALCNPTPCLFWHKISLPVHVGIERFYCIRIYLCERSGPVSIKLFTFCLKCHSSYDFWHLVFRSAYSNWCQWRIIYSESERNTWSKLGAGKTIYCNIWKYI